MTIAGLAGDWVASSTFEFFVADMGRPTAVVSKRQWPLRDRPVLSLLYCIKVLASKSSSMVKQSIVSQVRCQSGV